MRMLALVACLSRRPWHHCHPAPLCQPRLWCVSRHTASAAAGQLEVKVCADSHNRLQVPQARERVVQVVRVWLCPRQQRVRLCEHHVKPALHRPSPHASFTDAVLAAAQAAHAVVTECASRAQRTGPCSCVAGTCAPKRAASTMCQRTLCTEAVSAPGTETRPAQPAPLTAAAGAQGHTG